MKTDLSHKESIFGNDSPLTPKVIRTIETAKEVVEDKTLGFRDPIDLENFLGRMKSSFSDREDLHLELQLRTVILLENIDWKLWEIYSKFVK
jgi:hypothetical protein